MADSETLHDLFVDELKDSYDHEKQLIKALRKMAKSATHPDLAAAFTSHLEETNGQVELLEEVFGLLNMRPKGKHCAGIAGIIEEGNEAIEEKEKSPLLDAALVAGGKRAEHYEIAAYTSLIAMAKELGYDEAADRIDQILQQEIACDEKLNGLAAMLLPLANTGADDESDDDADDDSDDDSDDDADSAPKSASRKPMPAKGAKKAPAKKAPAKKTSRAR